MTVMVFSPNWLGDAVMALPAVADIRRHAAVRAGWSWRRGLASRACGRSWPASTRWWSSPRARGTARWRALGENAGPFAAPGPTPPCCCRIRCRRRGGPTRRHPGALGLPPEPARMAAHARRAAAARARCTRSDYYRHLVAALGIANGERRAAPRRAGGHSRRGARTAGRRRLDPGHEAARHRTRRRVRRREAMAAGTVRRGGRRTGALARARARARRRRGGSPRGVRNRGGTR